MEEITTAIPKSKALSACKKLFGPEGRLTRALPGFVARNEQIEMAAAVTEAISERQTLIVEAGTGTGKTYAYLVPSLLSRKRVILSTATKTLQDQLVDKDLPTLIKALGLAVRVQNLKGRSNYICLYRTRLFFEEGRLNSPKIAADLAQVYHALPRLKVGERGELPQISEEAEVWPYVTSTGDNCLGQECEYYNDCHLVRVRKRALESDVVVINHHLFFADSKLKDEGFTLILPNAEVIFFDEAHQLPEVASQFGDVRQSTRQIKELIDDTLREWPPVLLANSPFIDKAREVETFLEALTESVPQSEDKRLWEDIQSISAFKSAWLALKGYLEEMRTHFKTIEGGLSTGLTRCKERFDETLAGFTQFETPTTDRVRWLSRHKRSLAWHDTPIDVKASFLSQLNRSECAYIFTSATLSAGGSFEAFTEPLGLCNATKMLLDSPFDYKKQALLYMPRGLPDPKALQYTDCLIDAVLPIINTLGGRTFILFTSHKALNHAAAKLKAQLDFPLLVQGEESKLILLAKFREAGNAVLLGTSTFWEGVDVKGQALSCVVIDKIPFASPLDPVVKGKMNALEQQGLSSFNVLSLPQAIIALKQGIGRLIRDVSDKGLLVMGDPRLCARQYGEIIFKSIPPIPKTRCLNRVMDFINTLALEDETISD